MVLAKIRAPERTMLKPASTPVLGTTGIGVGEFLRIYGKEIFHTIFIAGYDGIAS